uniref:Uncharacterized protein n=1 Tax=Oryza brachyantha TaxID=4533 RepID=J3ME42_ORYBR
MGPLHQFILNLQAKVRNFSEASMHYIFQCNYPQILPPVKREIRLSEYLSSGKRCMITIKQWKPSYR